MGLLQTLGVAPFKQLDTVPSDVIYPSHMIDDSSAFRLVVLAWSFKFNDVLDPVALHNALSGLLEIGEWRKLGGRVRLNQNGRIEYHVPEKFTKTRPAVAYTHESLDCNLADHPVGPNYLECDGTSRTFVEGPVIAPDSKTPRNLSDYLNSDHPLMGLHIASFNDATVVGLVWPHFMMDIIGKSELLSAWSKVLAGKENQVPPFLGGTRDAAWEAGDPALPAKEEWNMLRYALSTLGMVVLGFNLIWAELFGPKLTGRHFVLTRRSVNKLVERARAEINHEFVSEGDVLTAWFTKTANRAEGHKSSYNVVQVMNLRFRLPSLVKENGVYITNMMMQIFNHWTPEYFKNTSVGEIALRHRRALVDQGQEEQVLAFLRCARQKFSQKAEAPLCIHPNADTFTFTSWSKAKIIETPDFSPALIRAGNTSSQRQNPPGSMAMFDHRRLEKNLWFKGSTVVIGKDHGGNTWMWSILTDQIWDALDAELRRIDYDST